MPCNQQAARRGDEEMLPCLQNPPWHTLTATPLGHPLQEHGCSSACVSCVTPPLNHASILGPWSLLLLGREPAGSTHATTSNGSTKQVGQAHLAARPKQLGVPAGQVAKRIPQCRSQLLLLEGAGALWALWALPLLLEQQLAQAGCTVGHSQRAVEQTCRVERQATAGAWQKLAPGEQFIPCLRLQPAAQVGALRTEYVVAPPPIPSTHLMMPRSSRAWPPAAPCCARRGAARRQRPPAPLWPTQP